MLVEDLRERMTYDEFVGWIGYLQVKRSAEEKAQMRENAKAKLR